MTLREEVLLLPEVPFLCVLAGGISILAMVVGLLVCIPRWVGRTDMRIERKDLGKAA